MITFSCQIFLKATCFQKRFSDHWFLLVFVDLLVDFSLKFSSSHWHLHSLISVLIKCFFRYEFLSQFFCFFILSSSEVLCPPVSGLYSGILGLSPTFFQLNSSNKFLIRILPVNCLQLQPLLATVFVEL